MNPVYQCLGDLRRRLWLREWVRSLILTSAIGGFLILLLAGARLANGVPPFLAPAFGGILALIPLLAAALTLRKSWSWTSIAKQADELGNTCDRFRTYLDFEKRPESNPLRDLARSDAESYAATARFNLLWSFRGGWVLALLLLAGLVLQVGYWNRSSALDIPRDAAITLLNEAAPKIEALAQKWNDPELTKAAETLREQALAMQDRIGSTPRREALEAIAKSEDQARKAAGNLAELQQVAEALGKATESAELRAAIEEKNYSRAAELAGESSADAMKRAIEKAGAEKNLPMIDKLGASSTPPEAAAQMLKATARAAARNKDMEKLLSALRDMKLQSGGESKQPPTQLSENPGDGKSPATAKTESPKDAATDLAKSGTSEKTGEGEMDGGGEGSELKPEDSTNGSDLAGMKELLPSILGPGESLQDMVLSTADDSKAKQRYQAIYQAAQADETAAVERENLPRNSRPMVNRYLESIRP